ncbi:DUF4139 domain-containing protein [Methanothrix sp.]|uniref:DUF4139 domain-containing protein n=1 Tax=Methanothrix sp. TaxID=90426 RepID=UPI00345E6ECF
MSNLKSIAALLLLMLPSLCLPAALAAADGSSVEATTAITLPVDSVTIYPDGLMTVKRTGLLDVTEGAHKFVVNVPDKADQSSVLLSVSNASIERVVYEADPIYTLNISSPGSQRFDLSYLMYRSAAWKPIYDLHLSEDRVLVKSNAVVSNQGGEDLKNVRLKLVAGLSSDVTVYPAPRAAANAEGASYVMKGAFEAKAAGDLPSTGELETLYIFELEGRKDLAMNKEIGFPLFEEDSPLVRIYTWDASWQPEGPADEEIRVNNTQKSPWPEGRAMLYRNGEYVSTIQMPYTPAGTNASIVVGTSADLKLERKLSDYNKTEEIRAVGSPEGNRTVKEIIQTWSYRLKIKSNLDRAATLEAIDYVPQEAVVVSISPQPDERTATTLKWKLDLSPRQETEINYAYQVKTTESLKEA